MSQYSETIGSFLRTGNYPLEANYIFDSEEELISFFEENKVTLHKGLLKVVSNEDKQYLYWVIEKEGELQFVKLLSDDTLELVTSLKEALEKETTDREEGDAELLDIINKFLTTIDNLDSKINTLPEIQSFLEGYSDSDKLQTILQNLITDIKGNPVKLQTIEALESALLALTQATKNRIDNLQTELDQTQIGVGLSGDGSYNADYETYYLKEATSVMNALKTLDRLIHNLNRHQFRDSNSASIKKIEEGDSIILEPRVKIAENSDIKVVDTGLYNKTNIEYSNGILTLKVNGEVRDTYDLGLSTLVEDAYYDGTTERIVILFKKLNGEVQRVEIPAAKLIEEWEVLNPDDKVIELTRVRVVDGVDTLSADVRISNNPDNILQKSGNALLVDGKAQNIKYKNTTVYNAIDNIQSDILNIEILSVDELNNILK